MKSMDFLDIPYIDHHGFTIPDCWTFDPAPEMKLSNEFQKSLKDTFIFCRVLVDRVHPARPPASAEITNILENQGFWVKSMGLMVYVPYTCNDHHGSTVPNDDKSQIFLQIAFEIGGST